jgi:hypothetical protein
MSSDEEEYDYDYSDDGDGGDAHMDGNSETGDWEDTNGVGAGASMDDDDDDNAGDDRKVAATRMYKGMFYDYRIILCCYVLQPQWLGGMVSQRVKSYEPAE